MSVFLSVHSWKYEWLAQSQKLVSTLSSVSQGNEIRKLKFKAGIQEELLTDLVYVGAKVNMFRTQDNDRTWGKQSASRDTWR